MLPGDVVPLHIDTLEIKNTTSKVSSAEPSLWNHAMVRDIEGAQTQKPALKGETHEKFALFTSHCNTYF